jgi:hypothetical protein
MSVNVLMQLLRPEEVRTYSSEQLEILSEALVRAIDDDPPTRARLEAAVAAAVEQMPSLAGR